MIGHERGDGRELDISSCKLLVRKRWWRHYLIKREEDHPKEDFGGRFHSSYLELCDDAKVPSASAECEHDVFFFLRSVLVASSMDDATVGQYDGGSEEILRIICDPCVAGIRR